MNKPAEYYSLKNRFYRFLYRITGQQRETRLDHVRFERMNRYSTAQDLDDYAAYCEQEFSKRETQKALETVAPVTNAILGGNQ